MPNEGLSSPLESLRDAARACFADRYGNPTFHVEKELNPQLEWVPALRFVLHRHVHVFVEPSDSGPYPRRLSMLYTKVSNYPEPIAVYSVCHEAAMDKAAGRELKSHGFGLVTVGDDGVADVEFTAVPIVQVIAEAEFKQQTTDLPKGIVRQRVSEAFRDYVVEPANGVTNLSQVVEGMIRKAGRDSAKNGGISNKDSRKALAAVLDALHEKHPRARGAIADARSFIEYRNLSHHWPKSKKDAYKKHANCRHHFLSGLHTIQVFSKAMKGIGLAGNLPRT